ncbi:hypothetical protein HDU98_003042 [Podochytrium sp. JEL0797]|nr:hypothetical protein HDU98_003042 [Podochytrium sp. JEL0797]
MSSSKVFPCGIKNSKARKPTFTLGAWQPADTSSPRVSDSTLPGSVVDFFAWCKWETVKQYTSSSSSSFSDSDSLQDCTSVDRSESEIFFAAAVDFDSDTLPGRALFRVKKQHRLFEWVRNQMHLQLVQNAAGGELATRSEAEPCGHESPGASGSTVSETAELKLDAAQQRAASSSCRFSDSDCAEEDFTRASRIAPGIYFAALAMKRASYFKFSNSKNHPDACKHVRVRRQVKLSEWLKARSFLRKKPSVDVGDALRDMPDSSTPEMSKTRASFYFKYEMEELRNKGYCRHIGVSNYGELLAICKIKPLVNQIELHPFLQNRDITEFCKENHIRIEAYSPLTKARKLDDPVAVNKTSAQVLIKWGLQKGFVSLPKSVNVVRLGENLAMEGWEIPAELMLEEGMSTGWDPTVWE